MITNCKLYITVGSLPKKDLSEGEGEEESDEEDMNQDSQ
jgi:hypothetical protein